MARPEPPEARSPADSAGGGPPDPTLLLRLRQRDERALELLYDRYARLVYTLALRIVGDQALAEEVVQDAFLRCWRGAEQFEPGRGSVAGWLMGVTRNRAIDLLRSRQHQARLREREPLPDDSAAVEAHDEEATALRHLIGDALASLPLGQRRVIMLAFYGGLTQVEIAGVLGLPLGTVKSRLRDGMERLRRHLRPRLGDEAGPGADE